MNMDTMEWSAREAVGESDVANPPSYLANSSLLLGKQFLVNGFKSSIGSCHLYRYANH